MGYFLPFYTPNNPKNQNFTKMNKIPGDIIILHMCTKNYDHMMYGSWDMMCNRPRDRLTDKLALGKKPWEQGWCSLRPWKDNTCLQFLGWTWLYRKFSHQSVEKKKICEPSCVRGIMYFIIRLALLEYSFPFLILVCYIRLVYRTSNFQIDAIALASSVKDILASAALVKQQACVVS